MRIIKHAGNFYDQRKTNRRWTVVLVTVFIFYYLLLGYGTDVFILKNDPLGLLLPQSGRFPISISVATALALLYVVYAYRRGADLVLNSVRQIDRIWWDDPLNTELINVVKEMSIAAGVPMPSVYLVRDKDPNAFATGWDPNHASIAVTSGLLNKLNREELQAAIAHEVAHIRNYDTRLMMLLAVLGGGSTLLAAYVAANGIRTLGILKIIRLICETTIFGVIWVGMVVFTPVISRILTLAISHEREYQADVTAAELTRNPEGIVKTLEELDAWAGPTWSINPAMGHMCIVSPMGKFMQIEGQTMTQRLYYNTHPPMAKRIEAMKEVGFLQDPRIEHAS